MAKWIEGASEMRRLLITLLLVVALTSCLVAVLGCGEYLGESDPKEAAQKVIDLVKSHRYTEARKCFMDPELLNKVVETLREKGTVSLGRGEFADSHSGYYPLVLNGDPTTHVMWFHVWRVHFAPDKWKIKSLDSPYPPQSRLSHFPRMAICVSPTA